MSATVVTLAQAVVDSINGTSFSQAFVAERKWVPKLSLSDMGTSLYVTVVPRTIERESSRGQQPHELTIDIGVQQKLAKTDPAEALAEVDGLCTLVEEIADSLFTQRLPSLETAMAVAITNNPVYEPIELDSNRVFFSLLTVTYRLRR